MGRKLNHAVYRISTLNEFLARELHAARVRGLEVCANAFETIAAYEPERAFTAREIADLLRGMVEIARNTDPPLTAVPSNSEVLREGALR